MPTATLQTHKAQHQHKKAVLQSLSHRLPLQEPGQPSNKLAPHSLLLVWQTAVQRLPVVQRLVLLPVLQGLLQQLPMFCSCNPYSQSMTCQA